MITAGMVKNKTRSLPLVLCLTITVSPERTLEKTEIGGKNTGEKII